MPVSALATDKTQRSLIVNLYTLATLSVVIIRAGVMYGSGGVINAILIKLDTDNRAVK